MCELVAAALAAAVVQVAFGLHAFAAAIGGFVRAVANGFAGEDAVVAAQEAAAGECSSDGGL